MKVQRMQKKEIFFIHVALYQQNLDDENTLEAFRLDVATFRKTRHENLVQRGSSPSFSLFCNSSLKLVSHDLDHANCLKSGVVHGRMYEAPSPCYSHFFVQGELSSNRVHDIPCVLTISLFL